MRELVSYTCSACAGALTVDKNQVVFECPFCGNAFDFAELHREEILKEASINMRNMEYKAAKDKFNSVLESDPQNFKALRGLALCDGNLLSEESINRLDKMSACSFDSMRKTLLEVKTRANDDDALYFAKLIELIELAQKHLELKQERENIIKNSRNEFGRIVNIDVDNEQAKQEIEDAFTDAGHILIDTFTDSIFHTGDEKTNIYGAGGIIALTFVLSGYLFLEVGPVAALIPIGMALLFFIFYFCSRLFDMYAKKRISKEIYKINRQASVVSSQVAEVEKQYAEAYSELKKLENGTNKMPPAVISD